MKGKLIVIEGSDSSGKKTQSKLLVKKLKKHGFKTDLIEFPNYNSKTGRKITAYLKGEFGSLAEVNPYFASELYAEDRLALRDKIMQSLKQGKIVVLDRYVLSNKAHQSVKIGSSNERESFFQWIDELEYKKNKLPKEDILLYLYVPVDISIEWNKKRKKTGHLKEKEDIHESNVQYLKDVEKQYLDLIGKNKDYIQIDCFNRKEIFSINKIHELIWKIVSENLNIHNKTSTSA